MDRAWGHEPASRSVAHRVTEPPGRRRANIERRRKPSNHLDMNAEGVILVTAVARAGRLVEEFEFAVGALYRGSRQTALLPIFFMIKSGIDRLDSVAHGGLRRTELAMPDTA